MNVTNDEHPKAVLHGLNELRERAELTDVVLEVEGRSFPCHRAILASCSPYFRGMFTSGYAEAKKERISIQGVSEVAMATILDYAYTGCLQMEPDQVQAVMSAARLLQVDFVCCKAAEYMKNHLDVSNCSDVLMYADMMGDQALMESCRTYIASRFNQVSLQSSFLQLPLPLLQPLLNRDDLMTNSEDDVVHAALRWIEFEKERLQNLPVLCSSFRHSFISREILTELESKRPSKDIKLVYSDSTAQRLGQTRTEMQIFVRRDWLEIASPYSAPCYDPLSRKLYKMNLPDRLKMTNVSMVATPDKELYLAGHIQSDRNVLGVPQVLNKDPELQKAFYQYNHLLNAWEYRCEMISPRKKCSLVCLKGYIYAVGGDDRNTVERYDRSCDEWTSIAPLPPNMDSPCAVCLDDSIYVLSGEGCYCFSPTENSWNKIADALGYPVDRQVVVYERRIYSLVWNPRSASVHVYSPEDSTWKPSGNGMWFTCDYAMLLVYNRSLYLITVPISDERYSTHWTLLQKRNWPPINMYKYQKSNDSWSKQDRKDSMVPPISRWMCAGSTTITKCVCLVAPMIPTALGDASSFKDKQKFMEGSSFQDNPLYGAELDMYGEEGENSSTDSFNHGIMPDELYNNSEDSTSDQESADGDGDREVENDDGDT